MVQEKQNTGNIQGRYPGQEYSAQNIASAPKTTRPYPSQTTAAPLPAQNYPVQTAVSPQPAQTPGPDKRPFHFLDLKFIIPLAVLVLVLAGVGIFFLMTAEPEPVLVSEDPVSVENLTGDPVYKDEVIDNIDEYEYRLNVIRDELILYCNSLFNYSGEFIRDVCFLDIANMTKDPFYCDEIITQSDDVESIDNCYKNIALLRGDPELCKEIDGQFGPYGRDSCYQEMAWNLSDSSYCISVGPIEGNYSTTSCAAHFNMTYHEFMMDELHIFSEEECQGMGDENFTRECLYLYAAGTSNMSACSLLPDEGWRSKNQCLLELAIEELDVTACEMMDQIGDELIKSYCYQQLAEYLEDTDLCDNITHESPTLSPEEAFEGIDPDDRDAYESVFFVNKEDCVNTALDNDLVFVYEDDLNQSQEEYERFLAYYGE